MRKRNAAQKKLCLHARSLHARPAYIRITLSTVAEALPLAKEDHRVGKMDMSARLGAARRLENRQSEGSRMPGFTIPRASVAAAADTRLPLTVCPPRKNAEGASPPQWLSTKKPNGHHRGGWDHNALAREEIPQSAATRCRRAQESVILRPSPPTSRHEFSRAQSARLEQNTPNPPAARSSAMHLASLPEFLKKAPHVPGERRFPIPPTRRRESTGPQNVAMNGVTSVQDYSAWADFQVYRTEG